VRRDFSNNGKPDLNNEKKPSTSKELTTFDTKSESSKNKRTSTTDYAKPKQRRVSPHYSQTDADNRGCPSPLQHDLTPCQTHKLDEVEHATGVGKPGCICIEDETAKTLTHDAECKPSDGVWSLTTTGVTTPTSTMNYAPTEATITGLWPEVNMPRRNRLKEGSGLDIRGRDSPVRRTVHWLAGIGEADAAKEAMTAWCGISEKVQSSRGIMDLRLVIQALLSIKRPFNSE